MPTTSVVPRLDVRALQQEHSATAEASLLELRQHGRVLKRTLDRGLAALRRDALTPETSVKIAKAGRDYERSYDRTLSRCAYAGVIVPEELVEMRPVGLVGETDEQAERLLAAHLARQTRCSEIRTRPCRHYQQIRRNN